MMEVDVWDNWDRMDGWSGIWPGPLEIIFGALALVGTIAFWAILIILLVKLLKHRPSSPHRGSSALTVLEERYARGEITREEYFERRAVLSGQPPPA